MADLIDRQAALDAIHRDANPFLEYAAKQIEQLPSARPNLQPTCNQLATDCISRQAAIDAFRKELATGEQKGKYVTISSAITYLGAKQILEKLPSAQPEIIRCKDCKWWDFAPDNTMLPDWHKCRWFGRMHTRYEDFCSRGERRE